jgi:hypothetical protein
MSEPIKVHEAVLARMVRRKVRGPCCNTRPGLPNPSSVIMPDGLAQSTFNFFAPLAFIGYRNRTQVNPNLWNWQVSIHISIIDMT